MNNVLELTLAETSLKKLVEYKLLIILFKLDSEMSLFISISPYTFMVSSETLLFPSIINLLIISALT